MRLPAALLFTLAIAAPAAAQPKEPIAPFVIDLRGAFGRHKAEPSVATVLGVPAAGLPTRTIGFVGGAHLYPLRSGRVTLGLGGNVVLAHGSRALDLDTSTPQNPVKGPTVRRHFSTISPEISLNFGSRNGWSYISAGMFGRSRLYLDREDAPAANAPYRRTLNYGGGARWFTRDHLALSVDFRWYSVAEQLASPSTIAQPRTTLLILSGGIAIR